MRVSIYICKYIYKYIYVCKYIHIIVYQQTWSFFQKVSKVSHRYDGPAMAVIPDQEFQPARMLSCRKSQKVNQWRLKLRLFMQPTKLSQMGVSEYGIITIVIVPSKLPCWQGKYQVLNISKPLEFGCFIPKFSDTKAKYYIFSWSSGFWRGSFPLIFERDSWVGTLRPSGYGKKMRKEAGTSFEHLLKIFQQHQEEPVSNDGPSMVSG